MAGLAGLPYESTKHLVVDIETTGINPPSPILTIGMVFLDFNPYRENATTGEPDIKTYYLGVDPKECIGDPDSASLSWWGQQDSEVRKAAFFPERTPNVFQTFVDIVNQEAPDYFWGNSPDFDFGHLGAQIKAQGIELPWKFWQLRDIRTLKSFGLYPIKRIENTQGLKGFKKHHALYDALEEANVLKGTIQRIEQLLNNEIKEERINANSCKN